jgi:long-chain fatty acid transport protein
MRSLRLLALASLATSALAAQAHAAGFYLQEQSARGTGRAYSGEVADQGVESLWWNPAAIARSGREAYVGASAIFTEGQVNDGGSTITYPGGVRLPVRGAPRAFKPIQSGIIPNFAIAAPVMDRFAVGVSVGTPYEFTSKYDPGSWTRYDGLTSQVRTADIQLTGAMRVTDWLDFGVAADAEYTKAHLSSAYPNLSPLLPAGFSELRGHGWNWGWTVGAQAHLGALTLGASYRSKMHHDLDGTVRVNGLLPPLPAAANFSAAGVASFTTPWIATFGARYALTDKLTLEGQVQRYGWSEFDAIRVNTPAGLQLLPQYYHDTTSGGIGLDYAVNPRLTLRTGVQYDPTPTPDVGRTARVPDGDRWLFGVGATANVTHAMKVDAAFAYIGFKDSHVSHVTTFYGGTPAATTVSLVGPVKASAYVLSLGLRAGF